MIPSENGLAHLGDCLMGRIWEAVSDFGGAGTSVTRNRPFFPCS